MPRCDVTPDDLQRLASLASRYGSVSAVLDRAEAQAPKPNPAARPNLSPSAAIALHRQGVISRGELREILGLAPKGRLACRLT